MVTRIEFLGVDLIEFTFLRNAPVSFIYDGSFSAIGWRWWSTNWAILDEAFPIALIIGRPGFPCL